jgi:hypothetical protein
MHESGLVATQGCPSGKVGKSVNDESKKYIVWTMSQRYQQSVPPKDDLILSVEILK